MFVFLPASPSPLMSLHLLITTSLRFLQAEPRHVSIAKLTPTSNYLQVLPSSFLHAPSHSFLPLRPHLPSPQHAPPQQGLLNHVPRTRQIRAHAGAGAAARPAPRAAAAAGAVEGFNAWLQKSHSTELTRWLEVRQRIYPVWPCDLSSSMPNQSPVVLDRSENSTRLPLPQ